MELILLILGNAIMIFGAIGVLRFPDLYTRLHASTKTDTGGAMSILIATALLATIAPWTIRLKLLILTLLIAMINPMISHAIARGAHKSGIKPIAVVDMYAKDNP
ncbi:MAG: monovalent cation/H(+) antiporter subunit G [Candidatus Thermoplasmatota archaeon]|nr:monovalent cation/H(+) antiporter subunit G [Candidatus Thermoplasmatota archaeon]MBS3789377.1 monovalent cation/H(+) antiporter subunit G [Candidatus Thermoplasmatota archaeon]